MRLYTLEEKNRIYESWKKSGCTMRELAKEFGLPSTQSAAHIVDWMTQEKARQKEKAGTVWFFEQVAEKTFLVIRPGWCWPDNVRGMQEHTGN